VQGQTTQGSLERQDFLEYYGGYAELLYLITQGDFTKSDIVLSWSVERFLHQGEYLLRKRIIENLK
jgi:hypothetical protein